MANYHGYGTITREHKTLKPNRKMCGGCYDEYYQCQRNGCWSFKDAKVVDKEAYPDIYTNKTVTAKKTLSCYHGVNK